MAVTEEDLDAKRAHLEELNAQIQAAKIDVAARNHAYDLEVVADQLDAETERLEGELAAVQEQATALDEAGVPQLSTDEVPAPTPPPPPPPDFTPPPPDAPDATPADTNDGEHI